MSWRTDDDSYASYPLPVLAELYADLDLMLLTAEDEQQRWSALIVGTAEVLDRFDHLAGPNIISPTGAAVIKAFDQAARRFDHLDEPGLSRLMDEVVGLLTAHDRLRDECISQLRTALCGGHDRAVGAINDAATSLQAAAEHARGYRFAPCPPRSDGEPNFPVMTVALGVLGAEIHRTPLRRQLDGAGGAAGSAEFNPYVAALCELELVTHRRIYRLAYQLNEHLGVDLADDHLFDTPSTVDRHPFEPITPVRTEAD